MLEVTEAAHQSDEPVVSYAERNQALLPVYAQPFPWSKHEPPDLDGYVETTSERFPQLEEPAARV